MQACQPLSLALGLAKLLSRICIYFIWRCDRLGTSHSALPFALGLESMHGTYSDLWEARHLLWCYLKHRPALIPFRNPRKKV